MPLPTNPPQGNSLQTAFQTVKAIVEKANDLATKCDDFVVKMQAQPTAADTLRNVVKVIHDQMVNFIDYRAVPNLDIVATNTIPGYTGSMTNDCQAAINAMQACVDTIINGIPKDGNGWVLLYKWNADGSQTIRTFTPAQMAGIITAVNNLRATLS